MKISVVTVVRNRVRTIGQALDSVAAQRFADVEHVVVDGASSDGTLDVITAGAHPRMTAVSEPDGGLYEAINKGMKRSTGDVVGLLHSDDFLADEAVIGRIADAFADPAVDGVYGDLDYVSAENTAHVVRHWRSGAYDASGLRWGWMPPHPTLYIRRRVFEQHGLYNTDFKIAADYDAMLRWLIAGGIKLAYVPHVFVKMRTGGASNGSMARILQKSREDYTAIRRNRAGGALTLVAKNLRKLPQFLASTSHQGQSGQ